MSFLLDTNICSAHIKRPSGLTHRFIQHAGGLFIPTIVSAELYGWAYTRQNPSRLLQAITQDLLANVGIILFDEDAAVEFGKLQGQLKRIGQPTSAVDLMIASVALVHNLTLVTHNTADFQSNPGLRLEDWLSP